MAARQGGRTSGPTWWPKTATAWSALRSLVPIALSCWLIACTSTDTFRFPAFERLEIVPASPERAIGEARTSGEMAARGAATGAASGAAAGLVVSLMCGPWYFECAAAMVPGMMASGGATDAIAGGVTSLSKEDTERFNRYLQTLPERRNLNEEMARRLADALPAERLATESADARLTIGIGAIQVFQSEVKTLELKLTALAALERHPGSRNPGGTEQSFTCTSERREVDEWLAHEGHALDSAITSCVNELAAKVNAALQEGPAR